MSNTDNDKDNEVTRKEFIRHCWMIEVNIAIGIIANCCMSIATTKENKTLCIVLVLLAALDSTIHLVKASKLFVS